MLGCRNEYSINVQLGSRLLVVTCKGNQHSQVAMDDERVFMTNTCMYFNHYSVLEYA